MKGSTGATNVTVMDAEKNRFRLTIAYDGRPWSGWQSQPGGNTVQDQIQAILEKICPGITSLHGSGRTDAGVSAEGQTAHFDAPSDWSMDSTAWRKALNAQLPHTIRIMNCVAAAPDFHARFSATGKIYRYQIHFGEVLPPLDHGLVFHYRNLPVDEFLSALEVFVGTHHFKAFSANRNDGKDEARDTERTIFSIAHSFPRPDLLSVNIHGNGFLYKMVRFIIGTAVYIAKDKIDRTTIGEWLTNPPDKEKAPWCAPPDGLSLVEVCYPERD